MANTVRIKGVFEDGISGPLAGVTKQFRGLEDAFKSRNVKAVFTGVGLAAGMKAWDALGGAIAGAGDFIRDSITAASDLNETVSKSRVVFQSSAREMERWAATMAEAGGLSKRAALDAAANFGNLFINLGQTRAEAARMSQQLVQLASDLASMNNLNPEDVLLKLRSGLSGEAEPMRSLGVFLSETKVKAKAMQMGLADAHGELSEGAKVLARYQIILDETKTAQGDFARTSDGLANTQRRVNADLENFQAELGKRLLPAQIAVTRSQVDLIGGLMALSDTFDALTGNVDESAEGFRRQATALATAKAVFSGLPIVADGFNQALAETVRRQHELEAAEDASARASQAWSDRLSGLAKALGDTAAKSDDAVANSGKLARAIKRTIPTVEQARRSWEGLAASVAEAIFGPEVLRGREAGLQLRLKELTAELKKEKDPLRAREIRGQIAEINEELFVTRTKLAALGDAAAKSSLTATIQSWKSNIAGFTDETARAYKQLLAFSGLSMQLGHKFSFQARARQHGGPVSAGEAYVVGERGPELFVPAVSGKILPRVQPAAPMAPVRLEINLDGRRVAEVVDEHLGWRYATAARTTRAV